MRPVILLCAVALCLQFLQRWVVRAPLQTQWGEIYCSDGVSREKAERTLQILQAKGIVDAVSRPRTELRMTNGRYTLVLSQTMSPQLSERCQLSAQFLSERFMDKQPVDLIILGIFYIPKGSIPFKPPEFISDATGNTIYFDSSVGRGQAEMVRKSLFRAGLLNDQEGRELGLKIKDEVLTITCYIQKKELENEAKYRLLGAKILNALHWLGPAYVEVYERSEHADLIGSFQ